MKWIVLGKLSDSRQRKAMAMLRKLAESLGSEKDYSIVLTACTSLLAFVINQIKIETGADTLATVHRKLDEGVNAYNEPDVSLN